MNAKDTENEGQGIHVGVLDTLGDPIDSFKQDYNFESAHDDYLDHAERDPIGHGRDVLSTISMLAHEAHFSTFQAINKDEDDTRVYGGNRAKTAQAIADAVEAGVDLINISAGIPHECGGHCILGREARMAAEIDNLCIVAATGNQDNETVEREGVNCPALVDSVIGVGGYVPFCSADIDRSKQSNQWWLENGNIIGPLCGQTGDCCSNEDCKTNRREIPWKGNVSFHNTAPDVLAPVIDVNGPSLSEITCQTGTSFAAPIISSLLIRMLGGIDRTPSTEEIQNAIRLTGDQIDESDLIKMNEAAARDYLS